MPDYYSKIKELEKELSDTKYNKRTQGHIGIVKAKIAKLRETIQDRMSSGGSGPGYSIRRSGDATVILVGYPSTGKSTLLNQLTNANSEVGAYSFTTLTVVPGTMEYKHAKIQVLDVPGIIEGAALGKGRGKEVLSVVRNADLCVILVDATNPKQHDSMLSELFYAGIRINQRPPDVKVKKKASGGISIAKTVRLTHLDEDTISSILREFRIANADVLIREDITDDQLIDVIEGNKKYIKGIVAVNKVDLLSDEQKAKVERELKPDIFISASKGISIDELKELVFQRLSLVRIYMKEPGKEADLEIPLIIQRNARVRDVCEKLHKDFSRLFKYARVWGKSARFPGQVKGLTHRLSDGDILEIHLK